MYFTIRNHFPKRFPNFGIFELTRKMEGAIHVSYTHLDVYKRQSKRYADIIVPEGGENQVALHMLVDRIQALLHHTTLHDLC